MIHFFQKFKLLISFAFIGMCLIKLVLMLDDYVSKNNNIKDTYILFDCLYDAEVESLDAYSLFNHMKKNGLKAYYVVLKDNHLYKKLKSENNLDNIIGIDYNVRHKSEEFILQLSDILPKAKAIITSFEIGTDLDYKFNNLPDTQYIFIQHGQIFFKESILSGGYFNKHLFDKILISSQNEAKILKKYGWNDEQFIKSGLPRWDLLNDKNKTDEKSIFIMLTWRTTHPSIFARTLYFKKLVSLFNHTDLIDFLVKNNVKIYFAPHHALKEVSNINFSIDHPQIEVVKPTEISKYIKKSSMLLTDFSSVAFDFMFQNKPVILYGLDRGDPLLEMNQFFDLELLKQKQNTFPNIFFNEIDVINKIKFYVVNDFVLEKNVADIYDDFFFIKKDIRKDLVNQLERLL